MLNKCFFVCLWMICGLYAEVAVLPDAPRVAVPEMAAAPALDGVIGETEWQDAVGNYGFVELRGRAIHGRQAWFYVGRKGETLYLAFRSETPPGGEGILLEAKPDGERDIKEAFNDDSLELVLDPKRGRAEGDRVYYHLIFNGNGAIRDFSFDPDNKTNPKTMSWRLPRWEMKNSVHDGWWDVEVAIPFAALGADARDLQTPWGVRLARNWKRRYQQSQWTSRLAGGYDDQKSMPVIVWDDAAPVVQVLGLSDPKDTAASHIRVRVRNPHAQPLPVAVYLQDAWHVDPLTVFKETATIAPNTARVFEVAAPDRGPDGPHHAIVKITSPDGAKTYYFRQFPWSMHEPTDLWQVNAEEVVKVELKFKYYPYDNKMRVLVDARGLGKDAPKTATATLHSLVDDRPGDVVWTGPLTFKKRVADAIVDIPELADGKYRIDVKLAGKNMPTDPLQEDFVRRHFAWEHNTLGISDHVIAPFTPLTVAGGTVGCVQRQLSHGAGGLWTRAVSCGKEVLAGPMAWEVEMADGVKPAVKGDGWAATAAGETEVVGAATWHAGPVNAELTTAYDYDGMMKCTLKLAACAEPVKRVTLKIPVSDRLASVMHACGDGNRHNYAGAVPAGEGKVWDSSQGNKIELLGTFYPYLWVGNGEQGICWFADTDRDWRLDDDTPVIDVVREGGTLWMNVSFITAPGALERPREIVFGLLVTPTKPMPEGWRRWICGKPVPGGRPVRVLGHSRYWGALYYLPYPVDHGFQYFEEMKRLREMGGGKPDDRNKQFVDDWMTMLGKYLPEGSPRHVANRRSITHGMQTAASSAWSQGWRMFGYSNGRGIAHMADEFPTFQDEWVNYEFFGRKWDYLGRVTYDATPSPSMIDCLLWWYRERLTCMEGMYWDCYHLAGRYDPVVGNAWTDDQGRVHPSLGIFALRDLVKRTAVMFAEAERQVAPERTPFVTMVHMTNTMVAPVLSFANSTLDWEWQYGKDDFQDRFTPELTVAEAIGRQVGAWPTILAGGQSKGRTKEENERVWRTRLGVCFIHEIQPWDFQPAADAEFYGRLFEFGYGAPECTVYNYWQDGHPVRVASDTVDARTIAIAKPGAVIVGVTDYGEGGDCQVRVDLAALGLDPAAAATDFESGEAIRRVAPGTFAVAMPKHGLRVLTITKPN